MLDTHWPDKLARERIAADLDNPELEADLYPVGSWRDHPPTGSARPEPAASRARAAQAPTMTTMMMSLLRHRRSRISPSAAFSLPASQTQRALLALMGLPACDGCVARLQQLGHCRQPHRQRQAAALKRYAPEPHGAEHLVHGRSRARPASTPRASRFRAYRLSLQDTTSMWPGALPRSMGDVQDLYLEKLDGKGNYQDADGTWKPLTVDHEVIKVRGGKDVIARRPIHRAWAAAESDPAQERRGRSRSSGRCSIHR